MLRVLSLLLVSGMMSGCAEPLARLAIDAADLHQATSDYVRENIAQRRYIRAECRASVVRQVETLRAKGNETDVQRVLRDNYPPLITMRIAKATIDGQHAELLEIPPSCGIDLGEFRQ